jgi:sugar phosphate isomerase/epimerase
MNPSVLEELKALGVEVTPQGTNLLIRPASKVPAELKERLRLQKAEVIAFLISPRAFPPSKPATTQREKCANANTCRYDWVPGHRGLRLHCVAHQHAPGTTTVFRMNSCGRDVLLEMAELGVLTGQALDDSRRIQ